MNKVEIRKKYLAKRLALSKDEVNFFSEKIFQNFVLHFKPQKNKKIHLFLPIEKFNEINTSFFIDYCFEQKISVFVPKIIGEKLISVEFTRETEIQTNSWGISEPKSHQDSGILDFDFVLTPLLYCDSKGNRVGYGKGFYDQLFSQLSSKTKKIGVNFFNPDENIDDLWENDIPLDYLVTPEDILSFKTGAKSTK